MNKPRILHLCLLLTAVLMLTFCASTALAGDVCTIDLDNESGTIVTDCSYIRLKCSHPQDDAVRVDVTSASGELIYSRSHGSQSGTFRSEDIHLRSGNQPVSFQVVMTAGNTTHTITVQKQLSRIKNAPACSAGYPLTAINGGKNRDTVTLIQVPASGSHTVTVPLYASGCYLIGSADLTISGGALVAHLSTYDGVSVSSSKVYAALTAGEAATLGRKNTRCISGKPDSSIDIGDAGCIAVYMQLTVSYDPNHLSMLDSVLLNGQQELWNRME